MELAFLGSAGFERWPPVLLTGVFAQRHASQASDSSARVYEVFFGVLHRQDCTPAEGNPRLPAVERISVMQ